MLIKKRIIICLCVILTLWGLSAAAETNPKVMVNGNIIPTDAVLINGRTYVPLRGVFEAAGASVEWDGETETAIVNMNAAGAYDDNFLPNLIAKISPSVVGIIGKCRPEGAPKDYETIAHGSGIIIKTGGEILTNAHVVKDMFLIFVVTSDGKSYEATLKYIDEDTDLAVIKINKIGLTVAPIAASGDIVVGRRVIAIGTPITFSLRNSATLGHITGLNRGVGSPYKLIQTDAAINPGNSGGALVNMSGEVIGITCSGYAGWGIQNTNFAIPVETINYALTHFNAYGKIRRASLKAELKEDWLAEMGVPTNSGLTIRSMTSESPLQAAGFKRGDILMSISGKNTNSLVEMNEILKDYMPGDTVKIGVQSDGTILYAEIELAEK